MIKTAATFFIVMNFVSLENKFRLSNSATKIQIVAFTENNPIK